VNKHNLGTNANIGTADSANPAFNPAYHATALSPVLASVPNPNTLPMQQHAPFQSPMPYQLPTNPTAHASMGEMVFDE